MRLALVVASVTVLSICAAAADPQTTSSTPSAVTAQPAPAANSDPNKMVCKNTPAKIGSRIGGGRECRTQREWDDITAQNQREIEKMQASGNLSPQGH